MKRTAPEAIGRSTQSLRGPVVNTGYLQTVLCISKPRSDIHKVRCVYQSIHKPYPRGYGSPMTHNGICGSQNALYDPQKNVVRHKMGFHVAQNLLCDTGDAQRPDPAGRRARRLRRGGGARDYIPRRYRTRWRIYGARTLF